MNFVLIFSYVEELIAAGPDAIALVKDVVRGFNDFRAGKLTTAEFNTVIDDCKKVAAELFGIKPATAP